MFWVVFRATNASAGFQIVVSVEGTGGTRYLVLWSNVSGGFTFTGGLSAGGGTSSVVLRAGETANTHLVEVADTVNGVAAYTCDGVSVDASAAHAVPMSAALLYLRLCNYNGGQFGNCVVRRVLVANDLPSAAQIAAMRSYLRAQPYGLSF